MLEEISDKHCAPCRGGVVPLEALAVDELIAQIPGWEVTGYHRIWKTFTFPDFKSALAWVVKLGDLAEQEGHHPEITLGWGKVRVEIWTHKANGLTENDFLLAAKVDALR